MLLFTFKVLRVSARSFLTLKAMKGQSFVAAPYAQVVYPKHLHLTRGNHESLNMNKIYGFEVAISVIGTRAGRCERT